MGLKWFESTSVRSRNPKRQWQIVDSPNTSRMKASCFFPAGEVSYVGLTLARMYTTGAYPIWYCTLSQWGIDKTLHDRNAHAKNKNKWQVYMSRAEHGFIFISTSYLGICTLIILGIINFRGATNFRETQIILLIHSYPISYPLVPPLNSQCGWGPETSNLWTNPNSKFYLNCWSHHIPRYSYRVTPTCLLLC